MRSLLLKLAHPRSAAVATVAVGIALFASIVAGLGNSDLARAFYIAFVGCAAWLAWAAFRAERGSIR